MTHARRSALVLSLTLLIGAVPSAGQVGDQHWPSFRGADAAGHTAAPLPMSWDVEDGTNIRWTTPIPGLGHSSPVIWGDRIFVTTAMREANSSELSSLFGSPGYGAGDSVEDEGPHAFRVYCLDKHTGAILWQRDAHRGVPRVKRHPKSTHANPTPACDATRVVVSFASEGLYCYDHDGTLLWTRDLGVLNSGAPGYPDKDGYQWGFASSPILHSDRVIIQCDVENESFIAALDATDGTDVWRVARDEDSTWGTPTVYERPDDAGTTVVVNGYKHIGGYDIETGKEIWTLVGGGDVPVPTPVVAHDLIYITNAHGRLRPIYAVRTDATGVITMDADECAHMQWCHPRKGVYMQTPLIVGDSLYVCADNGVVGCYDAKTGEERYRERLGAGGTGFSGSPITDGRHLYFTGESGEIFIVKPGPVFERVGLNEMGETCLSTPAASEGVLYVRTRGHLVAVGTGDPNPSTTALPLRLELAPGQTYYQRSVIEQHVTVTDGNAERTTDSTIGTGFRYDVLDRDDAGVHTMQVTYDWVRMRTQQGDNVQLDYDSAVRPAAASMAEVPYAAQVGQSFGVRMAPDGTIIALEGLSTMHDRMAQRITELGGNGDRHAWSIKAQFGEESLRGGLSLPARVLPTSSVRVGDTWEETAHNTAGFSRDVDFINRLVDVADGQARVEVNNTIRPSKPTVEAGHAPRQWYEMGGSDTGSYHLDLATGWIVHGETEQTLSGTTHSRVGGKTLVANIRITGTTRHTSTAAPISDVGLRPLDPPARPGAMAPRLSHIGDALYLSWIERADDDVDQPDRLCFSVLENGAWREPRTISERRDFFANWADMPSISGSPDGSLLAHWLQKSGPDTYAYDVIVARSTDAGETWNTIGRPHRDGTRTEHGFVSAIADDRGMRLFWLDGRAMGTAGHDHDHGHGEMALRTSHVTGASMTASVLIDDRVCECCNTDAAMTDAGPIVVYRDRGAGEVRDISIARFIDGAWTPPAPVHEDHWEIAGCPVNGPACAARGEQVAVAWYTGADDETTVRVAFSDDAGMTFGAPVSLNRVWTAGRTDIVLLDNGDAIVSWIEFDDDDVAIVLRRVSPDGAAGPLVKVANVSFARATGFPQLAHLNDTLVVIWTQDTDPTALKAVAVDLSRIPAVLRTQR